MFIYVKILYFSNIEGWYLILNAYEEIWIPIFENFEISTPL